MAAWTDDPVSGQIADDLAARIDAGEFDGKKKLPSIVKLEEHYASQGLDASYGTVRLALDKLQADGLIKTRQGRATEIVAKPSEKAATPAKLRDAIARVDRLERVVGKLDDRVTELAEQLRRLAGS